MEKILIIEDEDCIRNGVAEILAFNGYESITADNGSKALTILGNTIPDLIIADIMMPGLSGYETLNIIKENHTTSTIPFIFLTAKNDRGDVREGMNFGAEDYFTKPFKMEDLLTAIKIRLEKKKKCEEKFKEVVINVSRYLHHELRNPLVTIAGFTDMLFEDFKNFDDADKIEILKNIKKSEMKLSKRVEKFLFYTELMLLSHEQETCRSLLNNITLNSEEIIMSIVSEKVKEFAREEDIVIKLLNVPLVIKEEHFRCAVTEIIDNALRHTKAGTIISVSSSVERNRYCLYIMDYGNGFPKDFILDEDPFKRKHVDNYRQNKGGLGLAIVKRLSALYDRSFRIESETGFFTLVKMILPIKDETIN